MTDLEIIAAMEAELKALNTDLDVLSESIQDHKNELDSMEKEFK
jgi:hypothetical protein